MSTTLRSYQLEAVEMALAQWKSGKRSTLLVCPTGGGKTITFAEIILHHLVNGGKRALVLADREWLVEQAFRRIAAHTLERAGIEMGSRRVQRDNLPPVVCASIQSMVRRLDDFAPDAFDLIVIDEADLAFAPSYRKTVDYFSGARIFGCTATPERNDGNALSEIFEDVCGDVDIRDLIDANCCRHSLAKGSMTCRE